MSTLASVAPEISRDRFGRPLVIPVGGGKPVAYTRCTTFVDCLEDKYNLQKWQQRMVALGLTERADLRLSVAAHRDDKQALDRICEDALEAAKAHAAATTGTALHKMCENLDRGLDLGTVPDEYQADLAAYQAATRDLKATHIEQFSVLDTLKIGGTPDRIVSYKGNRYIADIKTGSIEYGILKIAMQLAVYARCKTYDIATGKRGIHDADLTQGLIIHLPAGTGTCELVWVDLLEGWRSVILARQVRAKRSLKFRDLTRPFEGSLEVAVPTEEVASPLVDQIQAAATKEELTWLWQANEAVWTDELTALAQKRIASLPTAS